MYIILVGIIVIILFIIYSDYIRKVFSEPDSLTLDNITKCVKMIIWNEQSEEEKIYKNRKEDNKIKKTKTNKRIKQHKNDDDISIDNTLSNESVGTSNISGSLTLMSSEMSNSDNNTNMSDGGTVVSGVTIENPKVFFEFGTKEERIGRINMELFEDEVPRTVKNFLSFVDGYDGKSYDKCNVHRIIPGFMMQTGDFERGDGTGGHSIYGKYFEDETFEHKHDCPGLLSMANAGPNTNGSQFFITFEMAPWLDDKHVVFGKVLDDSFGVLKKIEKYGSGEGKPKKKIKIINCGRL
jgi:peptidylprolyl isomerase